MTFAAQAVLIAILAYLGIEVLLLWIVMMAARWGRAPRLPSDVKPGLRYAIVTACRNGADCIPGLVDSFKAQDYPQDLFRLYLIADHCTDDSAAVGRSLGMEVFERRDPAPPGKGNALNDFLSQSLRHEPFDVMVVLDIDGRVDPNFLTLASAYFHDGASVLACTTYAKNPHETLLARVGDLIQGLLRLHQRGRAALGLDAILYGSHGYALTRGALETLGWRTTTGLIAEDMELRLRATVAGFPVRYARNLPVYNDVTADAASVREQRMRWNSTYWPLIPRYTGPLLRRFLHGDGKALETLFGVLLLPSFGNVFLSLMGLTIGLGALGWHFVFLRPYAWIALALWVANILYFFFFLSTLQVRVKLRDLWGFTVHVALRAWALAESVFYVRVKDWAPAPHHKDK